MGLMDFLWWPFSAAGIAIGLVIAFIAFAFWIWMIVDCAQRKFRNDAEKIVWIVLLILLTWVGAIAYYIAVRTLNKKGISK